MTSLLPLLLACPGPQIQAADTAPAVDTTPADTSETSVPDSSLPETADTAKPDTGTPPPPRAPFTLVALPDTQTYTAHYPENFSAQTTWIASAKDIWNIAFVLHEGDVTEYNTDTDWAVADDAMSLLDGIVPYMLNVGNHDMGPNGSATDRSTIIDTTFPPARFEAETWWGGAKDAGNSNAWSLFSAGGMDFIVLSLEFGADDDTLAWAAGVLDLYPTRRAILLTHAYLMHDDTRIGPDDRGSGNPHDYGIEALGVNDGEDMWNEFVSLEPAIFLVICGHIIGDTAGLLTSTREDGSMVHQVMADYQGLQNGGDGWLRILQFFPDEDQIEVSTYSPVVAARDGESAAWWDDPQQHFTLPYDMTP